MLKGKVDDGRRGFVPQVEKKACDEIVSA